MAKYIVQHRRGSAAQWAEKSMIIPMAGELVIEIDEENAQHKLKIGDGIHAYAELAYLSAGDEIVTQALIKALPRVVTITLDIDQWEEIVCEENPSLNYYGQVITLDNITDRSRLDLQPNAEMLAEFQDLNLVFVTENKGGIITVCSVGDMPLKTYTMQATIVETNLIAEVEGIVGVPVGTPTAKLPNPNALTFTGAVTGSYDGSQAIELEIPVVAGDPGLSPTAIVEQTDAGAEVIITDVNGTTSAKILNGAPGTNGKTAYQYAQDGGYTGTEEEFVQLLNNIPAALSDLSDDESHRTVTDAEKQAWNAKSDFSGSYNDLTDVPEYTASTIGAVAYTEQTLTEAQKQQARINIGVGNIFAGIDGPDDNEGNDGDIYIQYQE